MKDADVFLTKNKQLLEQFKRGDTKAMEIVYQHYHAGVHSFLRKGFTFRSGPNFFYFKGISDLAELKAAVQEIFRRVFEDKARASYNGTSSFTNWILAIARNLVINQFRNREIAFSDYISNRDLSNPLTMIDHEISAEYSGILYGRPSQNQDSTVEHDELRHLIDAFTDSLTQFDRKLMLLRFIKGKAQEETARELQSTRMKVRTAESKLRNRLRAYLRSSGYIDHYLSQGASQIMRDILQKQS